ncbi:nicotinamide mononucleotide transporter PnuC [Beggiatoa sp. PS]|nr:nicotinamide mononucleotide transporter PnuC [Beggiatoa sp. PS]
MPNFLSIDNIAFTIIGYPMSYVEFMGSVLYLWSVWLISKRRMLTWPVSIISVLLYMALFYQIRLYSDTLEQVYYLGVSIYGWWMWNQSPKNEGQIIDVHYSNQHVIFLWIALTAIVSMLTGIFMSRIHILFPVIFPDAASFPYLDALTTIMSFVAMWLMVQKKRKVGFIGLLWMLLEYGCILSKM